MAEAEPAVVTESSRTSGAAPSPSAGAFARAARQLVGACLAIAAGIAVAGSIDRTIGGVILVVGWLLGIASLHRLGRSGSDRGGERPKRT